jgi:hypothetical protein
MVPIGLSLINPGVKPVYARPYTVHRAVEQQLRTEIARLVDVGVLVESSQNVQLPRRMELSHLFLDFRKLNSLLKRHPFPIPKIENMIRSMEGFTFSTALDLNMGY